MPRHDAEAFERYNQLFDSNQYQALAQSLTDGLGTDRDSSQVSDAMNEVTHVALALCGYSHYDDAWLKLAVFCGQNQVNDDTIRKLHTYLLIFQQAGDTRADDFESTARALRRVHVGQQQIDEAVTLICAAHGWRGRLAYHMLYAASYFVQIAAQMLLGDDALYERKKIFHGIKHTQWALREGSEYSDNPDNFKFEELNDV